ncbi:MAG: hypothetical protein FH759_07565 [Sediminimonas qiaohouensis]|uniref:Uncharacterized protein n=1 Tax=Sediminimonas qiaohouensis TaxID=552061 RepID=A0A7C9L7G3_9RHOB|nr:toprim domain-containing protein [Sediminimonas qiaohouensis]MTJ04533.1 hypothetical protein [Sediminimonas qiaohouensis]
MGFNGRDICQLLGGHWYSHYGVAPCPSCQCEGRKDQNALTISDGHDRLLLNCKKSQCDFTAILAAAGLNFGCYTAPDPCLLAQREAEEKLKAQKKAAQAESAWREAVAVIGTPAEAYLTHRGLTHAAPNNFRFHPFAWHGPTAQRLPAMIAPVVSLSGPSSPAIHRTYLQTDGNGKADVSPNKLMLGATAGGCVRLSAEGGPLVVCEGIETGLSLLSGLIQRPATVVAALSTSGMRGLSLPNAPGQLIVAADGDPAGEMAAECLAERANALGWCVELLRAPEGKDFNDILNGN